MSLPDRERLLALAPGERAWFWFCPDATPDLVVRAVLEDPATAGLRAAVLLADVPVGAFHTLGLAQRGPDGVLVLAAPGLCPAHRGPLGLDATLVDVGADGVVRATHPAPAPDPLDALALGESAWAWLWRGPPLLSRPSTDPDGRQLALRAQAAQPGIAGQIQRTAGGLIFTSTHPAAVVWAHLPAAWVAEVDGDRIVRVSRPAGLRDVASGQGWFWLTDADAGGQPLLICGTSRPAVEVAAAASQGEGQGAAGRVSAPKGWLHFETGTDLPGLLYLLAELALQHPEGHLLAGARVTVRDPDGQIVARYRDDAVWSDIKGGNG